MKLTLLILIFVISSCGEKKPTNVAAKEKKVECDIKIDFPKRNYSKYVKRLKLDNISGAASDIILVSKMPLKKQFVCVVDEVLKGELKKGDKIELAHSLFDDQALKIEIEYKNVFLFLKRTNNNQKLTFVPASVSGRIEEAAAWNGRKNGEKVIDDTLMYKNSHTHIILGSQFKYKFELIEILWLA